MSMDKPPPNAEFVLPEDEEIREEQITVGRDSSSGQLETPEDSRFKGWRAQVQRIWIGRDKRGRFRSLRRKQ